jgi:hypothetical protein
MRMIRLIEKSGSEKWIKKIPFYKSFQYDDHHSELANDAEEIFKDIGIEKDKPVIIKRENCYYKLKLNLYINIDQVKDFLERCFKEAKSFKNVFIVGHNPIFTYKKKKGKAFISNKLEFEFLFDNGLFDINEGKNIYYLCADTHNYQHLGLTLDYDQKKYRIIQVISGTGGAEPDPIPIMSPDQKTHDPTLDLHVDIYDIQTSYGYSIITIEKEDGKDKINVQYKKISQAKTENFPIDKKFNIESSEEKPMTNIFQNESKKIYLVNKSLYKSI